MNYVFRIGFLTLVLALVATVTFASGESDQPAAAAEKEMVLDPSTGEMVEAPQYGGTLNYGRTGTGEHGDAFLNSGWATHFISEVVEKLVIADWAFDRSEYNFRSYKMPWTVMRGALAESWETPDATTIIAHIRPGVHWHNKAPMNGRELTASDVEFNYHRLLGIGSGFTEASAHAAQLPKIESVTATDASTVVFKLAGPDPLALSKTLDAWIAWIYPPEVIQEHGDIQDWRNLVGTGPMELTEVVEGSSMTWTRVPDYWGFDEKFPQNRLPYIDELNALVLPDPAARLAALRSGQLDMLGTSGDAQLRSIDQVESLRKTDPDIKIWGDIIFRSDNAFRFITVSRPPFDDIRVRRAMQMALDLDTIANTYFKGMADPTPQGVIHNDVALGTPFDQWPEEVKQYYRYDPEQAKQLLAEAGYPDGFKTTLDYFERYDANWAEIAIGYWAEIGVDVEMTVHDVAGFIAAQAEHHTEGLGAGENAGAAHDVGALNWYYNSKSRYNAGGLGLNDPHMDELIDGALAATTLEERDRLTKEANLYALGLHFHITAPLSPQFNVAQPWVKGYNGEISLSMQGHYSTYSTRVWIDQDLKRELGF